MSIHTLSATSRLMLKGKEGEALEIIEEEEEKNIDIRKCKRV